MKSFLVYMILSVLLIGCKQRKNAAQYIRELNTSDTFQYEFTVNEKGEFDSVEYRNLKEFKDFQKLPSLEKGFDSIQIRISYGCAMGSNVIVILTNQNSEWKAEVHRLGDNYVDSQLSIHPITHPIEYRTPKSGWTSFINELFRLKVLWLEDNQRIPGFSYAVPTDGCGAYIEVATKKLFRFYSYDNPDMYSYKFWQARNVLSILRFVNDELSINTDWPSSEKYDMEEPGVKRVDSIKEVPLQDIHSTKN